jgi:uncharacterized protein YdhG (YjbR/CyaY superfamily)
MDTSKAQSKTIDEYINTFPKEVQNLLQTLRQTIREEAPEAEETIKYDMPTFTLHGNLLHFAAFKNHISLYNTSKAVVAFEKEVSAYKTAKGSLRFPFDKPLPLPLIRKIVRFRVEENTKKVGRSIS